MKLRVFWQSFVSVLGEYSEGDIPRMGHRVSRSYITLHLCANTVENKQKTYEK